MPRRLPLVSDDPGLLLSPIVRIWFILVVTAFGVLGCSTQAPTGVVAGTDLGADGTPGESVEQQTLEAVLEPANAIMTDPGDGWSEVNRWYTEGAMTHWGTGCSGFDRLGDIFNYGTPQTVVWARGEDSLFQRTDDFGWDAGEFADAVELVPSSCSTVEIGSMTVSTTAVEPDLLGPAANQIGDGDPAGRVVAIAFDAYPHPSLETDTGTPEFEAGRATWMIVATRHNVVSQVVYSPGDGSGAERLPDLVAAQVDALLAAPLEATGPFEESAPPPSVPPGTADGVELYVDPLTCRNDGYVEHDGVRWVLAGPIPPAWRYQNPVVGHLAMDGTWAVFTADSVQPSNGGETSTEESGGAGRPTPSPTEFTATMTTGPVESVCITWEEPESSVPSSRVGRLDCDDRPIEEVVVPDTGLSPDDLAMEAHPQTVRVQSDGPLQWSGIDGGGQVIVALFLGDTDNANWQIFTCSGP